MNWTHLFVGAIAALVALLMCTVFFGEIRWYHVLAAVSVALFETARASRAKNRVGR
jgi:hypothetical protein